MDGVTNSGDGASRKALVGEGRRAGATADSPSPRPSVLRISAYQGGQSGDASQRAIKLSANENPIGPSPLAVDAYRRAADRLGVYPDGAAAALRDAIAAAHALDPTRIVCGSGSDELISLICAAFAGPGAEVLHTSHAFAMYRISALASGAEPVAVRENGLTADVNAILSAVTPRTRVVFLANPNNPTGTYLPATEIERLATALPPDVLLVLDGAYAEYMRVPDYADGLSLVDAFRNVVSTRTFSKIHGLAALRLGWMYAPEPIVDAINRVRGPFNVSSPALLAGVAAVSDIDYVQSCMLQNEVWRDWLTKRLNELGAPTPPSFGNFVLPEFGETGPCSAAAVDSFLRTQGLFVRRMESYGLPGHLRITVGAATQCDALIDALSDFMRNDVSARESGGRR